MAASAPPPVPESTLPPTRVESTGRRSVLPSRVPAPAPTRIADRYEVRESLGHGGFARVFRVRDAQLDREVALKQFALAADHGHHREQHAAFEREFHTLVQLSHPRIIEVYDFGVDPQGDYYTMELLDGGDLKQCAPMPWRDACRLLYDVCSSLALLHSRGFVHRDVSPGNVRRTLNGSAKLIDFGTLVPFGPCANVTGTPPFVAPEALHRSTLDGRTDLYSLGATLYYALTGRVPYDASSLGALLLGWKRRPLPPSTFVQDVPPALDALVLSLVSLDPAARPHSAFEVMQRLASIAGLACDEDLGVSQAYLATPVVVGRDDVLTELRAEVDATLRGAGKGRGLLIEGESGLGRSRLLDLCAIEAKITGAPVLRVNAAGLGREPLAVGRALIAQVRESLPALARRCAEAERLAWEPTANDGSHTEASRALIAPAASGEAGRAAHQSALTRWMLRVALEQRLALLVDDVDQADDASQALLATLSLSARGLGILLVATCQPRETGAEGDALHVLRRECRTLPLDPLSLVQTEALVISLFGDVPHASLVADRVHQASGGNPGAIMERVRLLLDEERIRYRDGRWVLPSELSTADLPGEASLACAQVASQLSEDARTLAQLLALASHPMLERVDFARAMSHLSTARLNAALTELVERRVFVDDGQVYRLAQVAWVQALTAGLDEATRSARHRQLAAAYVDEGRALERASQLLAGGAAAEGVGLVVRLLAAVEERKWGLLEITRMSAPQVGVVLDRAATCAEQLEAPPKVQHALRHSLMSVSVATDESHYFRAEGAVLAQLRRDAGLEDYERLSNVDNPTARVMQALAAAGQRFAATPEEERVCDPQAAIRGLCHFVVVSIANGARMQDSRLLASLPALLEPFAPLSPLVRAIWRNATATAENNCFNRPEAARRLWKEVLDELTRVPAAELAYVEALRNAILCGIGMVEARQGLEGAEDTARALGDDPMQAVSQLSLRKVARLHRGDLAGAERLRKRAERVALHSNVRSMFTSSLLAEVPAYALARDLAGLREVAQTIQPMAEKFAGWGGYHALARGHLKLASEQPEEALAAFEEGLEACAPESDPKAATLTAWPFLEAAVLEALVSLGRPEDARERGLRALEAFAARGIEAPAFPVRRALALAEARLGDYAGASQRLESVIEAMIALGVAGLELGATYEARTRVAIWSEDQEAVARFGGLTANEYRYGEGSSLGARYERLMDEARSAGGAALPQLVGFQSRMLTQQATTMVGLAADPRDLSEIDETQDLVDEAQRGA